MIVIVECILIDKNFILCKYNANVYMLKKFPLFLILLNKTWFVLNLLLDVTNIFIDTGYSDRGPQGGSRPSNDRWDSRSNRGNYGQFNDETGGNREWSRSASTRTYSNKPPLRATAPDRKPFPDESFQKDAPPPGM